MGWLGSVCIVITNILITDLYQERTVGDNVMIVRGVVGASSLGQRSARATPWKNKKEFPHATLKINILITIL